MPDAGRKREWLDSAESETSPSPLPRPELNPLLNPLLGQNMGRWAQTYFTSPPEQREQAVEKLLQELQAEAGGNKPPSPQVSLPAEPKTPQVNRFEAEFEPRELPMPDFTRIRPEPPAPAAHEVVVCPGCLHKNAVEQRFCGICGLSLTQEPAPAEPAPELAVRSPSIRQDENAEPDWQWLRQKTQAKYEPVQETNRGARILIGAIILLAVFAGGYFLSQSRTRAPGAQAPSSSPGVTQSQPLPAVEVPIPAAGNAAPENAAAKKPDKNATATRHSVPNETKSPASANESTGQPSSSTEQPSSDNGSDELEQGRRYLNGEGVPRNSWMASQWLWKSVAKQNSDAVLVLSDLYARGDGVPRSCEQARLLLIAAAKKGSSAAAQKLRSVERNCR
ncbi:MAG TPA: hypothetical protein VF011_02600 [Terriglobales bacterium]